MSALARLVDSVVAFESDIWGVRPNIWRGDDPARFDDVWSVSLLDDFLASGIRRPLVRLVRDGAGIDGSLYCSRVRLGGHDLRDVIDPDKVAGLVLDGATVVAQSLHRTQSTVRDFVGQLAEEISHPVQANAYLTPAQSRGLTPHRDRHDVLVVQTAGSKKWHVDGLGEQIVLSGDVMYIPAGVTHWAEATTEPSLHLTIGIIRVTQRALLQRVLQNGLPMLDDPLPLRYRSVAAPSFLDQTAATLEAAAEALQSTSAETVVESERARSRTRLPQPGALGAAVTADAVGLDTRLARVGDWKIETREGKTTASNPTTSVTAPEPCAAALGELSHSDELTVGELPGLDEPSRVILARRLVAAGLCIVS